MLSDDDALILALVQHPGWRVFEAKIKREQTTYDETIHNPYAAEPDRLYHMGMYDAVKGILDKADEVRGAALRPGAPALREG